MTKMSVYLRVVQVFISVEQQLKTTFTDENIERVLELVHADRWTTITTIAFEHGTSHGSVHSIFHYIRCVYLYIVPKMLYPKPN